MQVIDVCLLSQTAVVYSEGDIFLHLTILLKPCVDIVESENFGIGHKIFLYVIYNQILSLWISLFLFL